MKNIAITILSILLLITGGYLLYDKVLMEEENPTINNENQEQEINKTYIDGNDYEELVKVLQEKVKFTYDYFDFANAYCGEYGDEYINDENTNSNGFRVSKQFKNYQEMIAFLKNYMTEDIIYSKNSIKEEYYIEKDEKLYCEDLGKGGIDLLDDIMLQINKIGENEIDATIAVVLSEVQQEGFNKNYTKYDLVFTKSNDNWIISSYKKQS